MSDVSCVGYTAGRKSLRRQRQDEVLDLQHDLPKHYVSDGFRRELPVGTGARSCHSKHHCFRSCRTCSLVRKSDVHGHDGWTSGDVSFPNHGAHHVSGGGSGSETFYHDCESDYGCDHGCHDCGGM